MELVLAAVALVVLVAGVAAYARGMRAAAAVRRAGSPAGTPTAAAERNALAQARQRATETVDQARHDAVAAREAAM